MGEADPEMITIGCDKHLGFVAQAAEGNTVDDAVAVALKIIAWATHHTGCRGALFIMKSPAAMARVAGVKR
jgi:hypothetical protein